MLPSHNDLAVRRAAGARALGLDGVLLRPTGHGHGDHTPMHVRTPIPGDKEDEQHATVLKCELCP